MKFQDYCEVVKVQNIQQEENVISDIPIRGFKASSEMFGVYTKDGKFKQLYKYNDTHNIVQDLLECGYIAYDEYYGRSEEDEETNKKRRKSKYFINHTLEKEMKDVLIELSNKPFEGVAYAREELILFKGKLGIVHGGQLHSNGKNIPAFRYKDDNDADLVVEIGKQVGNVDEFKKDIKHFVDGFPLVQFIFAYYLSGAIRQVLSSLSEGTGEYGLVACITGEPGSGKSTVTLTLQNILFQNARQVSNNTTSIGLYKIIKNSGICPVVRDDSSTDTRSAISVLQDKVMEIYNIASGKCRITNNSNKDVNVYAPFIESREGTWSLADTVKPIRKIDGYKYRALELICHQGDLTKDARSAREFGKLSGKYAGMGNVFLDFLVDNYSIEDIHNIYREYISYMEEDLEKNNLEYRYANRTAVILATAKICNEAYDLNMDIDQIKNIMIDSIRAFETKLNADSEITELKNLYYFFKEKDSNGNYVNNKYMSDSAKNYSFEKQYVAFLQKKPDEFYIPVNLLNIILEHDKDGVNLLPPHMFGFSRSNTSIDIGKTRGERWKKISQQWMDLGILVGRGSQGGLTKTVRLNGISVSCYHFKWSNIARQFRDDSPLDIMRFACDTAEQELEEQSAILKDL